MKKFFFIILAIGIVLVILKQQTYNSSASMKAPYITVYGRTSCGYTRQMTRYLESKNIPYKFLSVDDNNAVQKLNKQMHAQGLKARTYYLPVVDVSGHLYIRPDPQSVYETYKKWSSFL